MELPYKFKLKDFTNKITILVFFDVLFLILPGTAVIYVVKPELFVSLDWLKLVMLSAAITTPFVLSNTLALAIQESNNPDEEDKDELFFIFTLATFITGLCIYPLLGVHYFFGKSIHDILIVAIILELLFFIKVLWKDRKNNRLEKE